ncbi:hypothetical protein HV336_14295 [Citrobacter freundii]|uniref:hypothetical protein n=1 Tax=Citrobacter freundii complex TaxID=1344959 RepID=UPI0015EB0A98|nr:hypothetical protein [Citrobacter freundii]QLR77975.1 hypothetical protein HV336_14295 [Citrobacter freundii]
MKKLILLVVIASSASLLSGCVSQAERLNRCQAMGIDRNVCYQEDMANQRNYQTNYSIERAGETQAQAYKDASPYHKKQKVSKLGKLFGLDDD